MKATKTKITFKEQIEGFPIWQIFITSTVRIVEPIAFTSLFPYVYFMVRDFHIAKTEAEISKYVGYLASCFSFCQFLSSIQWGIIADKIGRKRVLMIGLSGSTIGMLIFGFATNYWMALSARILTGFLNGNTGVLRTVIGENCHMKKHQALLLSTMPFLYQIGSILGPIIGGLLTNASDNGKIDEQSIYNLKDSIYYKLVSPMLSTTQFTSKSLEKLVDTYPYALSNIVISTAFTLSITCCFLFLEETHHDLKFKRDYGLDLGDKIRKILGFKPPSRPWHKIKSNTEDDDSRLLLLSRTSPRTNYDAIDNIDSEDEVQSIGPLTRRSSLTMIRRHKQSHSITSNKIENKWCILLKPAILTVVLTQVTMSAHNTVFAEFFPVFLAKRTMREGASNDLTSPLISKFPFKIVGGMGFDSVQVGKILSGTGLCGIFVVAILFPYIDRTYPPLKSFRCLSLLYWVIYITLPFLVFTLPPNFPSYMTTIILYSLTFTRVVLSGTTVPFIVLFIHRASTLEHRAFINGASISAAALARFFGPLIWGNIMSFAELRQQGWITWWSLLSLAVLSFCCSFKLKEEEDEEEEQEEERNDDDDFDLQVAEQEEEELEM